jgi:oligopeptidase B
LIKSYGCYGLNLNVSYTPSDLYLLSQGYSIAYAHIRGGSERGSGWHEAARKEKKIKSVQDLEDVIKYFRVDSKYCDLYSFGKTENLVNFHEGIFAESDSAGGTLLMSLVNQKPGLLDGVVLTAPFLNLKTLADET